MALSNTIHHTACPVCGHEEMQEVLSAKDYTVSQQEFSVWQCNFCQLRFTQDAPDAESIGKYYASADYISHSNEAGGMINSMYRTARKFTLKSKCNLIAKYYDNSSAKTLLDIGAGTGAFAAQMQQQGWKVTAVEPDEGARESARRLHSLEILPSPKIFALPQKSFAAITLWHVLEHVHQLHEYVAQMRKLLAPGGTIFIAVPNYQSPDAEHYTSHWAAYDVPRHLYHFAPQSMRQLMEKHGMMVEKILPMRLDAFYISLLSEKYKNGSTNWFSAAWHGFHTLQKTYQHQQKASSLIYLVRA